MEKIFGRSDIDFIIAKTEAFLSWLKKLKKEKGNIVLNPNYSNLLIKLYETPDIMLYTRR